jgi:SAM-dependent methyltransferase
MWPRACCALRQRFQSWCVRSGLIAGLLRQARANNPEIVFLAGNMLELPLASGKMAGIIAFYSIIHFDEEQVLQAFQEMSRALRPGGNLLLGVHVGREVVHADELWGIPVDFDATFFDLDETWRQTEITRVQNL